MNACITSADLARFRAAIVQQIGLQFDDAKLPFLDTVLRRRLNHISCSGDGYLERLEARPSRAELQALAQELTVCETYFFRHNDQFRALAEMALPERMRARAHCRNLNLLSAGCASGEEAYSLAIVAREALADRSWEISIRAVDLNPLALEKAARGRYSSWALRDAPPDARQKWFHSDNRDLVLDERVRGAVRFDAGNLAADDPQLWQAAVYDVIFCRNVLMYFSPEQMAAAVGRMASALAPGGYLFLGHAETLRGISDEFHLCRSHDTFYYQRKERGCAPRREQPHVWSGARSAGPEADVAASWVDAIRAASERVATLVAAKPSEKLLPEAPPMQAKASDWRLAPVFGFLRCERFAEALDYVRSGPAETAAEPDVLIVKAVLLVQHGDLPMAAETCRRLLAVDELNAGAHYVLALCREHSGEHAGAIEHDRIAAHLDPTFAMPRLHCGLLARRCGDRDTARRELAQAQVLLKREDVARLLLFGGGFSREALIALCQSAGTECGADR
jgi:chemotaxis protein methyltransferase CheR